MQQLIDGDLAVFTSRNRTKLNYKLLLLAIFFLLTYNYAVYCKEREENHIICERKLISNHNAKGFHEQENKRQFQQSVPGKEKLAL